MGGRAGTVVRQTIKNSIKSQNFRRDRYGILCRGTLGNLFIFSIGSGVTNSSHDSIHNTTFTVGLDFPTIFTNLNQDKL